MRLERTLVRATGWVEERGLHTGEVSRCRVLPAPEGCGLIFRRVDSGGVEIPALIHYAKQTQRYTSLEREGVEVMTVEHILCALRAAQIDNAVIEVEGKEIPDLDGAALAFYNLLHKAGTKAQKRIARVFCPAKKFVVEEGEGRILLEPAGGFEVSYRLSYGERIKAEACFSGQWEGWLGARTFCLEDEIEELHRAGYGRGAKKGFVLVLRGDGGEDKEEAARHKVIDLIGDLALLGCELRARIFCERSGHAHNRRLCRMVAEHMEEGVRNEEIRVEEVMRALPHRYPFLMVDRVLFIEPGRRAVGLKNVTINEPYFQGHFPGRPVMPGVLQIEAMAQLAGVLLLRDMEKRGRLPFLMSIDGVKFRRPVVPGDQLVLEAEVVRVRGRSGEVATRALVDGKVVSEARIKFMVVEQEGGDAQD